LSVSFTGDRSAFLKQPADGHSIYSMSVPTVVVPALLPHLGIRPDIDFAPITGFDVVQRFGRSAVLSDKISI